MILSTNSIIDVNKITKFNDYGIQNSYFNRVRHYKE